MPTVRIINQRLHEKYKVLDGRPIYRIIPSLNELETRFSDHWTDWYGKIIIREEYKAIRTVRKYWYIDPPCYILEKLTFPTNQADLKEICRELVTAQSGSYEPVYVFRDKDNQPLPVEEEIVERLLYILHNPQKTTPGDIESSRIKDEAKEVEYFENNMAEDERSPLFVWENSAFVSTNQLKFKQEYIEKSGPIEVAK